MRFCKTPSPAMIVALIALFVALSGSATAVTVTYAQNSDKVDGKHAVSYRATVSARKGKLVATSGTTGRLPNNIIAQAPNANLLDGINSTGFYQSGSKVADANLFDGIDSTGFYQSGSKVADANLLDGIDSTGFALASHNHDGRYYLSGSKVADADKLDGIDSGSFALARYPPCCGRVSGGMGHS
jgi:hypothetical protein